MFQRSAHVPTGAKNCHVAIIPDGARRWAAQNQTSLSESYARSVALIVDATRSFFQVGVEELTFLCSVAENRNRQVSEVSDFVKAGLNLDHQLFALSEELGLGFRFFGLDEERVRPMSGSSKASKFVNVVFDYDPFLDIANALNAVESSGAEALEDFFGGLMLTRPIDFVIRTGGYKTLSNFVPLLVCYARLEFRDELFNDLHSEDLLETFDSFFRRPRLYGL